MSSSGSSSSVPQSLQRLSNTLNQSEQWLQTIEDALTEDPLDFGIVNEHFGMTYAVVMAVAAEMGSIWDSGLEVPEEWVIRSQDIGVKLKQFEDEFAVLSESKQMREAVAAGNYGGASSSSGYPKNESTSPVSRTSVTLFHVDQEKSLSPPRNASGLQRAVLQNEQNQLTPQKRSGKSPHGSNSGSRQGSRRSSKQGSAHSGDVNDNYFVVDGPEVESFSGSSHHSVQPNRNMKSKKPNRPAALDKFFQRASQPSRQSPDRRRQRDSEPYHGTATGSFFSNFGKKFSEGVDGIANRFSTMFDGDKEEKRRSISQKDQADAELVRLRQEKQWNDEKEEMLRQVLRKQADEIDAQQKRMEEQKQEHFNQQKLSETERQVALGKHEQQRLAEIQALQEEAERRNQHLARLKAEQEEVERKNAERLAQIEADRQAEILRKEEEIKQREIAAKQQQDRIEAEKREAEAALQQAKVEEQFGEQNFRVFSEMRRKILVYRP